MRSLYGSSHGFLGRPISCAILAAGGFACAGAGRTADSLNAPAPAPTDIAVRVIASLPLYEPRQQVSGVIRLWGHGSPKHDFMGKLVERWTTEFHRYQPHVTIENRMFGTASAIGALYSGAGDLAILGEEISPAAEKAFERERHYVPTRIEIATGSLDVNYFDYAHMIFVNRANPIRRLTLGQLAAIFGDGRRNGSGGIRAWGGLGLTGDLAHHRIQPYSWKVNQDFALFFRARVLEDNRHWNPHIREFVTRTRRDGTIDDRGRQILDALSRDPYGIAISNVRFANSNVKAVRLAYVAKGPYVAATAATLISQRYPLTRIIPAFVDVPPGRPIDPAVREFLRFILSRQGQQALVEVSGYLPLGRHQIRSELRTLDRLGRCRRAVSCRDESSATSRTTGTVGGLGHPVPGVVRVWGNPSLAMLARRWAGGFRINHPHVRIDLHMSGSDTGMAGLYTGKADVALLGRAATDSEVQAFEWVFRHPPSRTEILRGSLATPGASPALVVLVHKDNPLRHVDFAQLRALFEPQHLSAAREIETWGQLGLVGEWANRPVHLYIADSESGTVRFFRDKVLSGSALLEWPRISELGNPSGDKRTPVARRGVLRALKDDRFGLAVANLPRGPAPVKALAVAVGPLGPYVPATRASIRDGHYPLSRAVYAYSGSGSESQSEATEFIRYIRSRDGQSRILPGDGYLPLAAGATSVQVAPAGAR